METYDQYHMLFRQIFPFVLCFVLSTLLLFAFGNKKDQVLGYVIYILEAVVTISYVTWIIYKLVTLK